MSIKTFIARKLSKILPTKLYLYIAFYYRTGDLLNLKTPKTINEKLQWKKLYSFDPIHTVIADKLEVRKYISSIIGSEYLIPLHKVYENIDNICIEELPQSFVFKSNNGSGQVKVIRDKFNTSDDELKKLAQTWLNEDHYSWTKERQYKDIKTKIFAEHFLQNNKGDIPNDYKLHCFSGKVEYIQVNKKELSGNGMAFFDKNWVRQPFIWGKGNRKKTYLKLLENEERPSNLNEMISLAEKISSDFDYIRVDFYNVNDKVYFGELTLHSTSGFRRFYPKEYNRILGKMINIPKG